MTDSNENLTDQEFWDHYWTSIKLPVKVDTHFSFERCLSSELTLIVEQLGLNGDVLEIGAAPGKWLDLFSSLGFRVSGIEYSPVGSAVLSENLHLLGVEPQDIVNGDFFSIDPEPRYDVVMSFGFIEHFEKPANVVARHAKWLRPGGTLILGVPNFRYVHGRIQRMIDMNIMDAHNTEVMDLKSFAALESSCGLKLIETRYLGSFEPALPMVGKNPPLDRWSVAKRKGSGAFLRAAAFIRRASWLDNVNHPYLSSYLLSVSTKR